MQRTDAAMLSALKVIMRYRMRQRVRIACAIRMNDDAGRLGNRQNQLILRDNPQRIIPGLFIDSLRAKNTQRQPVSRLQQRLR